MNTTSFVKILRKVIREEVQSAVKEALGEKKISPNKVINHGISLQKMVERNSRPKKKFSKNEILNDILNETANTSDFGTMYEGPNVMQEEYPTMEEQVYTSDKASSFKSLMNTKTSINATPTTDVNGNPVDTAAIPKGVTDAFTRDYSSLMKTIDKKKSNR
tara:strand:- start:251 stop:733 length:483 start_codon:yes stop_codon:yes gene_type:complete